MHLLNHPSHPGSGFHCESAEPQYVGGIKTSWATHKARTRNFTGVLTLWILYLVLLVAGDRGRLSGSFAASERVVHSEYGRLPKRRSAITPVKSGLSLIRRLDADIVVHGIFDLLVRRVFITPPPASLPSPLVPSQDLLPAPLSYPVTSFSSPP